MIVLIVVLLVLLIALPVIGWTLWIVISAAFVGALIGGLARLVIPGRQEIGVLATIVIGWIGSLLGSLIGRHVTHSGNFVTLLLEIGVAAVLVLVASSGAGNSAARRSRSLRY